MSYLDMAGLTYYNDKVAETYVDKSVVDSLQSQAEFFDPLVAYRFEKHDGTLDANVAARSSATDYHYNMTKDLASHGRRYFALANRVFEPGVYTLSAYITLADTNTNRVCAGIGRTMPWTQKCYLMTEKGGTTRSTTGSGWISYTFAITDDNVPWSFMIEAVGPASTTGTMSNVSLTKATSKDEVARGLLEQLLTAIENKTSATINGHTVDFSTL